MRGKKWIPPKCCWFRASLLFVVLGPFNGKYLAAWQNLKLGIWNWLLDFLMKIHAPKKGKNWGQGMIRIVAIKSIFFLTFLDILINKWMQYKWALCSQDWLHPAYVNDLIPCLIWAVLQKLQSRWNLGGDVITDFWQQPILGYLFCNYHIAVFK